MKKRIWLVPVITLLVAILGVGTVYAAGGGIKVFERSYTVQIEPIEVVELMDPITTGIKPGQPITVAYKIINRDTQHHWNVVAQIEDIVGGEGLGSTWRIEEENVGYAPGTPILIPSNYYRTLKVTFTTTQSMSFKVRIYRTTSEEGKG